MSCERCGLKVRNQQDFQRHVSECSFQRASNKICRYFVNGGCVKGSQCVFLHPEGKQFRSAPPCRNGGQCKYLAQGVCSFFHRGYGVQRPRNQFSNQEDSGWQNTGRWCKFLEDCESVSFCSFKHYDEVFPQIAKARTPPIGGSMWDWQYY